MMCSNCWNELSSDAIVCPKCGTIIKNQIDTNDIDSKKHSDVNEENVPSQSSSFQSQESPTKKNSYAWIWVIIIIAFIFFLISVAGDMSY